MSELDWPEYPDPDQCCDCGRRPVVERSADGGVRWCRRCVDAARWEMRAMAQEHAECSLRRAGRDAAEQDSAAPLRAWVAAWGETEA